MQSISLWWLRLRHGWRHRFAHKPLCDRFARDVLRIGPLHVCRSCTLLYAGIAVGFALWALLPASPWALAVGLGAVLLPSAPPVYTRLPRGVRDVLRFGAGLLLPMTVAVGVGGALAAARGSLAVMWGFWRLYFLLRGARRAAACNGCPELTAGGICSGFAQQADAFRQYEEAASSMLMSSGQIRSGLRGMP